MDIARLTPEQWAWLKQIDGEPNPCCDGCMRNIGPEECIFMHCFEPQPLSNAEWPS